MLTFYLRKTATTVGAGRSTVQRYLKKAGYKSYRRRKVQAVTDDHHRRRVEFAQWMLDAYGRAARWNKA